MVRRSEDDGTRDQILGGRGWEFFFCRRAFRDGDVTGRFHELLEFLVRHRRLIHPEAIHAHAMNRLRVVRRHRHLGTAMAIRHGAHRKFAAGNPDHPVRGLRGFLADGSCDRGKRERARQAQE